MRTTNQDTHGALIKNPIAIISKQYLAAILIKFLHRKQILVWMRYAIELWYFSYIIFLSLSNIKCQILSLHLCYLSAWLFHQVHEQLLCWSCDLTTLNQGCRCSHFIHFSFITALILAISLGMVAWNISAIRSVTLSLVSSRASYPSLYFFKVIVLLREKNLNFCLKSLCLRLMLLLEFVLVI